MLRKLSIFFGVLGIALLAISVVPVLLGNFKLSKSEVSKLTNGVPSVPAPQAYQPAYDPKLPSKNHLVISAIGVDTDIEEATYDNYEAALKNGVWRVSDFGAPGGTTPTILAAHRYGYLAWTNLYRRKNSFYNLPKLQVGDLVEIDWQKRKYVYEIYATDEGTEITDYSANLILYTCVNLTGNQRIFRYAKLINL